VFNELQDKQISYQLLSNTIYLVILVLMATIFVFFHHHLALQKFNLRACSAVM
jgi:hypothetical protein